MKIQIEEADLSSVLAAIEELMGEQSYWWQEVDRETVDALVKAEEICKQALEHPAQQDIPKIGCVNHDCDKCKAQQQELDDLYAERKETVLGMLAYSTSLEEEIKRLREEQPAQQQQQPYAWMAIGGTIWRHKTTQDDLPLYTSPPASKPWVGLTDEEFQMIYDLGRTPAGMMELVEAKLKEKNA